MSKTRIEAFTDAVIAIVMTILVLELHAPEGDTFADFFKLDHKLLIYVVSFISLAIYWNNHHHLFQLAHKINGRVLWMNNLLIFSLSLMPFGTAWMGDHLFAFAPEFTYGVIVTAADISYYLLTRELVRANGSHSPIAKVFSNYRKTYISIGLNILGLLLGFIQPLLVLITYIVVLIFWVIPEKKIEAHYE